MNITMNGIVKERVIPKIGDLCDAVYSEKENLILDGVKAIDGKEPFIPGTIVNAYTYVFVDQVKTAGLEEEELQKLNDLLVFTAQYEMTTFGILCYLSGLYRLHSNGIPVLTKEPALYEELKKRLHWNVFVNKEDLTLQSGLPFNYYSVAFRVAKFRELLGWEDDGFSKKFLDIFVEHVEKNSGEYGYMDETLGDGRFDRYTLLVPAELCTQLSCAGMEVPDRLKEMLRRSCDVFLQLADSKGNGFSYGRSIGAHGDTAALEVLSIAAKLQVLTPKEMEIAHAYNLKVMQKVLDFWVDPDTGLVNLWDKGRKTDGYRNKKRILEVNLDILMKLVEACDLWNESSFKDSTIPLTYEEDLRKLPGFQFYRFDHGEYDRAMAIVRDGEHVFMVPFINGAKGYYTATPYLPIPYENNVLEASPNTHYPNLVPRLTMADGSCVMPIVFMENLTANQKDSVVTIEWQQEGLCLLGGKTPQKDERLHSKSEYTFEPGRVKRKDTFICSGELLLEELYMEFSTFSEQPVKEGNRIYFLKGPIKQLEVRGIGECSIEEIHEPMDYGTPHGRLKNKLVWKIENVRVNGQRMIEWEIVYK